MKKNKKFPRVEVIGRQLTEQEAEQVKGGQPPPGVYKGKGKHLGWVEEPIIVPLYGVIIDPDPI